MSNFFIGTDIVSVKRIAEILDSPARERFKNRTYSPSEISYCQAKANPPIHFAGRFAAKEALKKALLSSKLVSNIPMRSMEVIANQDGSPSVNLDAGLTSDCHCQVSISHTDNQAIAFALVIVEK